MKKYFPSQNGSYTYLQTNRSDLLGSIWSTFNLDFQSNLGAMRLAPRLLMSTTTADDSDLGCSVGFKAFDGRIWTVTGTRVFSNAGRPDQVFTEDASSGASTDYSSDYSDLETFNARLWTSAQTVLYSKPSSAGAWTNRMTLNTATNHVMCYFRKFNRLYVSDLSSQVKSIDSSDAKAESAGDYFIDLGSTDTNTISCLKANSTSIWIGIINRVGLTGGASTGSILEWDGISAQVTTEYKLNAQGCAAIVIGEDDIPYAMDTNGVFLKYTGSNFEEVGRLPVTIGQLLKNSTDAANDRFIHPNGIVPTPNDTFLSFVNNENQNNGATINENFASGVYEFSKDIGFTHKYAVTETRRDLSFAINDFGQNRISRVGGIANMNVSSTNASRNGTLLIGSTYFSNASSTLNAISYNDFNNTFQKKGYFVTTWFQSDEVSDKWTRLWGVYKRFLNLTDEIILKYRLYDEDPLYASIIWVTTTSFTTTTDPSAYWTSGVGGEVEGIQGPGSGNCAHITNIVNNAGTYTVTVDEAFIGVNTETAKVRFQKWVKLFPAMPLDQVNSWSQFSIPGLEGNPRIQIKGCLTFTGNNEFYKMALFSNEDIKINA